MEKLKSWLSNRNSWHYILAVPFTVLFYMLTYQAYVMHGRVLLSILLTFFAAMIWEFYRLIVKKSSKIGWDDIKRAMYVSVPTAIITMLIHAWIIGEFIFKPLYDN